MEGRGRLQWRRGGLKLEPWRVCRPVVADSHHLDEEQDTDSEMRSWIRIRNIVKRGIRIRIRIEVKRDPDQH
jgi:hypothetical protein